MELQNDLNRPHYKTETWFQKSPPTSELIPIQSTTCFESDCVVSPCLLCFQLHVFDRSLCSFGHALLAAPSLIVSFSHVFLFVYLLLIIFSIFLVFVSFAFYSLVLCFLSILFLFFAAPFIGCPITSQKAKKNNWREFRVWALPPAVKQD